MSNTDKMHREAMRRVAEHPSHCNCGTCAEAYTTAKSMVEKNAEYQCDMWMLQVAYAVIGITKMRMFEAIREDFPEIPVMEAYAATERFNNSAQTTMFAHCLVNEAEARNLN